MKDIQDKHETILGILFNPGHPDSKEEIGRDVDLNQDGQDV